jgi:uncharacterized protein (TIGR00369 family)
LPRAGKRRNSLRNRELNEKGRGKERAEFLVRDFHQVFIAWRGYSPEDLAPGKAVSRLTIEQHHLRQGGFVHAGVMATMADHTAGYSAFTLAPEICQALTIEFKINFFRPAHKEALACRFRVLRNGKTVVAAESEVFDTGEGKESPVAKATVAIMAAPREKLAGKAG